jgi:hypothetical protein
LVAEPDERSNMKAPISLLTAALVWGNLLSSHGQEAAKPAPAAPSEPTPATESPAAIAPASGAGNTELVSVFSPDTLRRLGIDPNARVVSVMTNRLDVMEGRRTRVEGGLVPLIKVPSLLTFFQLFNPFAPAEYGGMSEGVPGSGFSRAFADPIKTYPTSPLISVGGKPEKSIARQKAGTP